MPDETNTTDSAEGEAKPTITIAEKQGGTATATASDKDTITIAEKEKSGDE